MGLSRRASGLLLALLTACARSSSLPIRAEAGDLVVWAGLDGNQVVATGMLSYAAEGGHAEAELTNADLVLSYRLAAGGVLDSRAEPVAGELLNRVRVRSLDQTPEPGFGACGRCLIPPLAGPLLLQDGASCSVPLVAIAEAYREGDHGFGLSSALSDSALLDDTRKRLRIDVAGECPCLAVTPPSLDKLTLSERWPSDAPEGLLALDEDENGVIWGASSTAIVRYDPTTGTRVTRPIERAVHPVAGVTLEGGSYLLVFRDPTRGAVRDFEQHLYSFVAPDRILDESLNVGLSMQIEGVFRDRVGPDPRVYVYGKSLGLTGEEPTIVACTPNASSCRRESLSCGQGRSVESLAAAPDGTLLAGAKAMLFRRAAGASSWACEPLSNLGRDEVSVPRMAIFGDTVVGCAETSTARSAFAFALASLPRTDLGLLQPAPNPAGCGRVLPGIEADALASVTFERSLGEVWLSYDSSARLVHSATVSTVYGAGAARLESLSHGSLVVRSLGNDIGLVLADGSVRAIQGSLLGPARPDYNRALLLPDDGALLLATPFAGIESISGGAKAFSDPNGTLGSQRAQSLATVDSAESKRTAQTVLIVRSFAPDGGSRFSQVVLDEQGIGEQRVLPWQVPDVRVLAEVGPDRFLILASDGWARIYEPASAEPLRNVARPETFLAADIELPLTSIAYRASAGVVWLFVSGKSNLFRFSAVSVDVMELPGAPQVAPPSMLCPDDVLIGTRFEAKSDVVRIHPLDPSGATELGLVQLDDPDRPSNRVREIWPLFDGDGVGWIEDDGVIAQLAPLRRQRSIGFTPRALVQLSSGILAGAEGGRAARAEIPR